MSSPSDRKRARELVERIAQEKGFVAESILASISDKDTRYEIERALLAKDKIIGSAVLTLAKNLYTSNARFVYELLQNADDNKYTALEAGKEPFVSFSLYSNRLVVDCNEDGFQEANLQAICAVGESSKSKSQGYIGEKGIGFKSVFMAAWKVHIQSGHLSFSFVHRKGDPGMGMVNPIWEEPTEQLPHSFTRITLFLHDDQDGGHQDILKQFEELEPTLLLFVRQLRRIDISFYDQHEKQEWATRLTIRNAAESNRSILERRVTNTNTKGLDYVSPETYIYHVTKHRATNIAKSENRTLSPEEEASQSHSESEIVLAFPLSKESVPIIEAQKVFAFLPTRQMGFNFIIQADFVTQANREDVVTTSRRNQDLIKAVANAFIKAVGQFCHHTVLQYTWMRYLPREKTHHWDPFWKGLVNRIKEQLQYETVLWSRTTKRELRRIRDLKWRDPSANDRCGRPLFKDLDPELYLSDFYAQEDVDILKDFGLGRLPMGKILEMVRQDLQEGYWTSSRLRSARSTQDWHSRVSSLLGLPFREGCEEEIAVIRQLNIIPLDDGTWVSATEGEVIYGNIGAIPVPKDLGLRILAHEPATNAKRRELFDHLGVRSPDVGTIRSRVLDRYTGNDAGNIGLDTSLRHLRFLYLTHESGDKQARLPKLLIHDHLGNKRCPATFDLYIQDDHPYGAHSLLGPEGLSQVGAAFANPAYFQDVLDSPSDMEMSWTEWMHDYVGVRRNIPLTTPDEARLSGACKYIAKHKSDKFMGFLRHIWSDKRHFAVPNTDVREELRELDVICTDGERKPLGQTYLPLAELQSVHQRFWSERTASYFISLPDADDVNLLTHWSFLADVLGVGSKCDLGFRMAMLGDIGGNSKEDTLRALKLYQYIEAFCMGSPDPESTRNSVREYFKEVEYILLPDYDGLFGEVDHYWLATDACLWEAPAYMMTKTPLRAALTTLLGDTGPDLENLRRFFQQTLQIPDVSHIHIIEDLQYHREEDWYGDTGRAIRELYGHLQDMCNADPRISEDIRTAFEEDDLVYIEDGESPAWYSPSQCLWSGNTSMDSKIAISNRYGELETLFREVLGVRPIDFKMVYDSLLEVPSNTTPVDQVKQLLLDLNSLLPFEKTPPVSSSLIEREILPVVSPSGERALCSCESQFVIVDREELITVFGDRVRYLDFTLKQVCRLRPFISWAGLEGRYLSRCVEEVSRVQGGVEWPISEPDRDLRRKAYGILRIAAKYNSPRFEADPRQLYDLLHTAITVEAAGISSRLMISQDGKIYEHEVGESELHIEEQGSTLKIYAPRDKDDQEVCFLYTLPQRLLSWLMTPSGDVEHPTVRIDDAATSMVKSILNCRVSAVSALLQKDGVPEITEVQEEEEPPEDERAAAQTPATPTARENTLTPATSPWSAAASSSETATPEPLFSPSDNENPAVVTPLTDLDDSSDGEGEAGPRAPAYLAPPNHSLERRQSQYRLLLASAIVMAHRIARRDYASSDIDSVFGRLTLEDDVFTPISSGQNIFTGQDRFVKIGAAGELFVFELLSNLHPALPSFGRHNWQSRIRHHVAAHPNYNDLVPFDRPETSDIVYDDASGLLTNLLIGKGHLSRTHWAGKTPRYYVEVKSTLKDCATPFFVSDGQVERMRTTTNGPSGNENQGAVYVIFRVFGLGTEATGLKIYVDPEQQRRSGKLRFAADKYAVTPGQGA